ncbi:MAG: CAP domain-containing protein [Nitrosotalea sp.]
MANKIMAFFALGILVACFVIYDNAGYIESTAMPAIKTSAQSFHKIINRFEIRDGSTYSISHLTGMVQKIIQPNASTISSTETPVDVIYNALGPKYSGTQLQEYALQLINQDRAQAGLSPVVLSSNQAASSQAQDILGTRQISHWMTDGDKPYMSYTEYGGLGAVQQNVATALCEGLVCSINPMDQIKAVEYDMMYNDASSDWGHKENILDPHHTSVSLGISYNDNTFVIVQNFENNYISFTQPITYNSGTVSFSGILAQGKIDYIEVDYDSLPTPAVYAQNSHATSYTLGTPLAIVDRPLPLGQYYEQPAGYTMVTANQWSEQGNSVAISFDASKIITKPGVYDVLVWLDSNGQTFPATYYSIVNQ